MAMESVVGDPQLRDVEDMHFSIDLPPTRELGTDRPARSFESQGRTRHAKEERTDLHRELKRGFAKRIAGLLRSKLAEGRYQHLILIAPPVTLGDLRAAFGKAVRERIRAELPQDLVKMPTRNLRRHLHTVLPINLPIVGRTKPGRSRVAKARRTPRR
jgi:protein required for attachment to host cells